MLFQKILRISLLVLFFVTISFSLAYATDVDLDQLQEQVDTMEERVELNDSRVQSLLSWRKKVDTILIYLSDNVHYLLIKVGDLIFDHSTVGEWNLDDNSDSFVIDSSGANPDGIITGATRTEGISNQALLFSGGEDSVAIPNNPALNLTEITALAWIKPASNANFRYSRIIDKHQSYTWWIKNDMVCFRLNANTDKARSHDCIKDVGIVKDHWQHIAFSYNGKQTKLYLNGKLVGVSHYFQGPLRTSEHPLIIGNNPNGRRGFQGVIDEVKLYQQEQTEDKILEVYQKNSQEIMNFGIISDIHWKPNRIGSKEWASSDTLLWKIRLFKIRMRQLEADFAIQLGDVATSTKANLSDGGDGLDRLCTEDEMVSRLETIKMVLEQSLDIPFYHVMGNHEYKNPDWNQNRIYQASGFNSLEDSWYTFEMNDFAFVVMNTAYKEAFREHIIPEAEITWLEETLNQIDKPTFVFMHVPINTTTNNQYDHTQREDEARAIIEADPEIVAVFFGHNHHSDEWDRLRAEETNGVQYYHVNDPNQMMDNNLLTPWGELSIFPGYYEFKASYTSDIYQTRWTGQY